MNTIFYGIDRGVDEWRTIADVVRGYAQQQRRAGLAVPHEVDELLDTIADVHDVAAGVVDAPPDVTVRDLTRVAVVHGFAADTVADEVAGRAKRRGSWWRRG